MSILIIKMIDLICRPELELLAISCEKHMLVHLLTFHCHSTTRRRASASRLVASAFISSSLTRHSPQRPPIFQSTSRVLIVVVLASRRLNAATVTSGGDDSAATCINFWRRHLDARSHKHRASIDSIKTEARLMLHDLSAGRRSWRARLLVAHV